MYDCNFILATMKCIIIGFIFWLQNCIVLQNAVASLWLRVHDLFSHHVPKEDRHLVFTLIRSIILGQFGNLGMLRKHFFNFIKSHTIAEDISYRLNIVVLICM